MTVHFDGLDVGFVAAEDLSGMQYRFVHQATDTTVDLLDSGTEYAVGILQNAPILGETAVVRVSGTSKLVVNNIMQLNRWIKAEYVGAADNGKGDVADTAHDPVRAVCIKIAGAENDVAGVLLTDSTHQLSATFTTTAAPTTTV
jgi:hypothetical protein